MTSRTKGLVDTNILILQRLIDPDRLPDEILISTVTLAELSAGPHHAKDVTARAQRLHLLQRVEAAYDPLPFDTEAARTFGQVTAAVLAAGRHPRGRGQDLMIASIAIANQLPLYTTNPRDFAGLEGLLTVIPVERP